jgi:hypothetical protein
MADNVNHPSHYNAGSLEVIDAIEGLKLGFHAGNVVKYVARYKHKNGIEDLRKALWYLERLIHNEQRILANGKDTKDVSSGSNTAGPQGAG